MKLHTKYLAFSSLVALAPVLHAQTTLIDVSFPGGTGTNPTFLEIDNGLGGGTSTWTQSSGVLFSNTTNNSAVAAASDTTIDFTTLGDDSLTLTVVVGSRTGTQTANGMFIGFQQRDNNGTGADLWNNNPPSFGLTIPGNGDNKAPGNGGAPLVNFRAAAGGSDPSAPGRYQFLPAFGTATNASISDGFTVTLTVDLNGWEIVLTGLEDATTNPITGGSGAWGSGGINDWAEFESTMRVGFSYQTTGAGGNLNVSSINLVRNSELDTDMDGMPDEYEDANGLDKNFAGDASQGANDGLFDNDGRTNLEEYNDGTDPNVADVDGDNLNDGGEFTAGTNPFDPDSDDDGLNDGQEVNGTLNPYEIGYVPGTNPAGAPGEGTNPLVGDSDNDSISDFDELDNANGSVTNPNSNDTDGDGLFDDEEIDNNLDPTDATGDNGAGGDPDMDNLSNNAEIVTYGTNPQLADTDGDGLDDDDEVFGTLNPFKTGHNPGDPPAGTPGAETNPLVADSDNDGLNDFDEVDNSNGSVTDPNDPDTDQDTLSDGDEIAAGIDPTVDGSVGETSGGAGDGPDGPLGDPDGDNLSNADEVFYGTNAQLADTDGDTLNDDVEVLTHLTDPNNPDTDGDLIRDDEELVPGADNFVTLPTSGDTDGDTFKDHIEIEAGSDPTLDTSTPTFPAITWSAEELNEESDFSTEGTLLFAENLQGADLTINSIPFTGRVVGGNVIDQSSPNLQTLTDTNSGELSPSTLNGFYDDEVPALSSLVTTFWFQSGTLSTNYGITGLTPGQTYLVQIGRVDDRGGSIINRYMLADGYGGGNELDPIGPTNLTYGGPDNPAILCTGTFTAQHTVQVFSWEQYLDDDTLVGTHLPFIQVREIETPADIVVTGVQHTGSAVNVSFSGLNPASQYQLVRSATLQDGFPTIVDGPRLPAGTTDTFTDSSATLPNAGFYQLEEMP